MVKILIAPQFSDVEFDHVNLNETMKLMFDKEEQERNFPSPFHQTMFIDQVIAMHDDTMLFGGWLEDQRFLNDHFLVHDPEQDTMIHIGLDIMLPIGTRIVAHDNGTVVDVFIDKSTMNGWGGRVTVLYDNPKDENFGYMIYGHLHHQRIVHVGQLVQAGDTIGYVTNETQNGGWFPHVHIQVVDQDFMNMFAPKDIDGLVTHSNMLDTILPHVVDPTCIVFDCNEM